MSGLGRASKRRVASAGLSLLFSLVLSAAPASAAVEQSETAAELAKRQLPKLYSGAATDFARRALIREYPFTEDPTSREINCKRRLSRVKFRCQVSFFAGDSSYRGGVQIRYIRKVGGRLGFRYAMRLVHTNEYCVFVLDKPRRECQDRLKEKGNDYV